LMLILPKDVEQIVSVTTFGLALALLLVFFIRVAFQIRHARPELYFKPHI